MKEQIIEILKRFRIKSLEEDGTISISQLIYQSDFDKVAEEIEKLYHSEEQLDKIDKRGGWICPRCQKVHSWLSMTCDCPPNVITASTTKMRDIIHKIIWDELNVNTSAKEIAEMMTAFIEWIRRNADGEGTDEWFIGDDKLYTLEELFTFWHTEIYKKQKQ